MDNFSNVYIAGDFADTLNLNNVTLINQGSAVYIAKYSGGGALQWAKIVGSDSAITVSSIHVSHSGSLYITGQFYGQAIFGNQTLTSGGSFDVFLAKFDSAGIFQWAHSEGGHGYDYSGGVSSDYSGNVYVTGELHSTDFQFSGSKIFISKYNNAGNLEWSNRSQNYINTDLVESIRTDSVGNSYITGQFFDTLIFSNYTLPAGNIEANMFLGKFNAAGVVSWFQKAGSSGGYCSGMDVDFDEYGNCYAAGFFHGTISAGQTALTGAYGTANETFLVKTDNSGNYIWSEKVSGRSIGRNLSINQNKIFVSGTFNDTLIADSVVITNDNIYGVYILTADTSGAFHAGMKIRGDSTVRPGSMHVNNSEMLFSGNYLSTLQLDTVSLFNPTFRAHGFLAKYRVSQPVGITELHDMGAPIVFPNPSDKPDQINFSLAAEQEMTLKIFDSFGRIIFTDSKRNYCKGLNSIRLKNILSPGLYFLHFDSSSNCTIRLIVN